MSWDIPNYITLVAEIAVGLFIAWYIHRMQVKSDKTNQLVIEKIGISTSKIDSYLEEQKKVEYNTKKYYLDSIRDNLQNIREYDRQLKKVIQRFWEHRQLPNNREWSDMAEIESEIKAMCEEIKIYLKELRGTFKEPDIRRRLSVLVRELALPYTRVLNQEDWSLWDDIPRRAEEFIDKDVNEIDSLMDILEKEYPVEPQKQHNSTPIN